MKKKIKEKKTSSSDLTSAILQFYKEHAKKSYNPKQIQKKLNLPFHKDEIKAALDQLAAENKLIQVNEYQFRVNKKALPQNAENLRIGKVDMTRTGSAYILTEGQAQDVYIPSKDLNGALNGDKVRVLITYYGKKTPEGIILDVLERATDHFIGTIRISKKYAFVIPDRSDVALDIYVPISDVKQAKDGDKVVVKVLDWMPNQGKSPVGIVTSCLGAAGSSDIEMKSILINAGFELEFPDNVLKQANALPSQPSEAEIAKRRDMRNITTFTIDPDNAKDFDDALSVQFLADGACEVGVHIADVSHYIKTDTVLDKEAYKRSTSVYLVDRVLPMLPERLSNELCSLRPHEDKLTFSAIFQFDKHSNITQRWFGKTIIHSDRRFTYEEAQIVLETKQGDFEKELHYLNELAHKLRKARYANGSIALEADEVKFKLDEFGTPISIYVRERKDAHMLVEDFMLLANKEVALFIDKKNQNSESEIPYIYRIHDSPDPEKLANFARFAGELGHRMNLQTNSEIAKSFNKLAELATQRQELKVLAPLAIRTMAKAAYSSDNIGHYGLAFPFYSHFTSPIRRYSDVLAHRILDRNLKKTYRMEKEKLEEKCKYISTQERRAMEAERESIKYKQVEFIKKHVGEEFDGIISGFMDRGMFIELKDSRCEGFIPFQTMDEPMMLDEGRLSAIGKHSGKKYRMGGAVRVVIVSANQQKRQIEMELL